MNLLQIALVVVFLQMIGLCAVDCLVCYVCDDEGDVPCKQFETKKDIYAKQCESRHGGCSVNINGSKRSRSCEVKKLHDCQIANSVRYCFCFTDLCNDSEKFLGPSDDEDGFDEGSGIIAVNTNTVTEIPVRVTFTSTGFQTRIMQNLLLMAFTSILLN